MHKKNSCRDWGEAVEIASLERRYTGRLKRLHLHLEQPDGTAEGWNVVLASLDAECSRLRKLDQDRRVQQWRADMGDTRNVVRFVSSKQMHGLRAVMSDGCMQTTVDQMDSVICEYWQQVAGDKAQAARYEEAQMNWIDELGLEEPEALAACSFPQELIQEAIMAMRVSSVPGIGGWHPSDLRALPERALSELGYLYQAMLRLTSSPSCMKQVWTSHLPKVDSLPECSQLRPIAVTGSLWRVYTSCLCRHRKLVVDRCLDDAQFGGRPARSTLDAVGKVRVWMDSCLHDSEQGFVVQLDLQKYFNCLSPKVVSRLCRLQKASAGFAEMISQHYGTLQYRNKYLMRRLGGMYTLDRGMPQGDAASVLGGNLVMWMFLQCLPSNVQSVAYLDDLTLMSRNLGALKRARKKLGRLMGDADFLINHKKSVFVSVGHPVEDSVIIQDAALPRATVVDMLGSDLATQDAWKATALQGRPHNRRAKAEQRMKRIALLPGGDCHRVKVAQQAVAGCLHMCL